MISCFYLKTFSRAILYAYQVSFFLIQKTRAELQH